MILIPDLLSLHNVGKPQTYRKASASALPARRSKDSDAWELSSSKGEMVYGILLPKLDK